MKFSLPYTALFLFVTCHLIFCEDWTHSGGKNNEEKEDGESKNDKKPEISISVFPFPG